MANKQYRIALMGASGAGKTVFLGSYFHLVTNLGQGRSVSLNTPEAAHEAGRIIQTLFRQQVPVKEKARKNSSFMFYQEMFVKRHLTKSATTIRIFTGIWLLKTILSNA